MAAQFDASQYGFFGGAPAGDEGGLLLSELEGAAEGGAEGGAGAGGRASSSSSLPPPSRLVAWLEGLKLR